MKRILMCAGLVVVVALVFAAAAFAVIRHFSGTVQGGGTVSFATRFDDGKTKSVRLPLKFTGVPISCDQGDTTLNYSLTGSNLKVTNRKFSFVSPPGGATTARIAGTFTNKGKNANGTFRDRGTFAGGAVTGCDTGTVNWTAHK
jgi:hypothetical protein